MSERRQSLRVPADHPALPGHFPGRPLVPGVVLLELAARCAQDAFALGALRKVTLLKFVAPVLPGVEFDCVVTRGDGGRVAFRIELGGQPAAHGSLLFGEAP